MSPTDDSTLYNLNKVVSFRGTPAAPSSPGVELVSQEQSELEASLVYIATFLLDNKDNIRNVVCGVMAKDGVDPKADDFAFHMLTTPIDVADFALSLRFLEDGFRRYLPDPD
jgi:hypothetical protein